MATPRTMPNSSIYQHPELPSQESSIVSASLVVSVSLVIPPVVMHFVCRHSYPHLHHVFVFLFFCTASLTYCFPALMFVRVLGGFRWNRLWKCLFCFTLFYTPYFYPFSWCLFVWQPEKTSEYCSRGVHWWGSPYRLRLMSAEETHQ